MCARHRTLNSLESLLLPALLLTGVFADVPPARGGERPWEGAAFSADGQAVFEAAKSVEAKEGADVTVLYEEATYIFDAQGRRLTTSRQVYRLETPQGAKGWATVQAVWEPWHLERPEIRARVITSNGNEHRLDPSTIGEYPLGQSQQNVFDDRRALRAPLPAVAPGAIVEYEILSRETVPLFDGGVATYYYFGNGVPTVHTRLLIDWPASLPLRSVSRLIEPAEPRRSEADGRVTLVFENGAMDPVDPMDPLIPSDIRQRPYVAFGTGKSWADVAARLAQVLESKIDVASVQKIVQEAIGGAKGREEIVARLLAYLRREVRYTGIEFGEASLIPRAPAETLKRKYGDCKDQSTLLVTMLRAAGINAQVVALQTGPAPDIERDLPGLGIFDHSIVYVPGSPPLWIDPTASLSRLGQLPLGDEGRLALIVNSSTRELVRTPESSAADNRFTETREFVLPEDGKARVNETTEVVGSFELNFRSFYKARSREDIEKQLNEYAKSNFAAQGAAKVSYTDPEDLAVPFRIRVEATGSELGTSDASGASVGIPLQRIIASLPDKFKAADEEDDKAAGRAGGKGKDKTLKKTDQVMPNPFVREWRYTITVPAGFSPLPLPEGEVKKFGPATLSKEFALSEKGGVTAMFRFDTGKRRMSWEESQELRRGVEELQKAGPVLIRFEQVGEAQLEAGKIREALAEFRKLAALHPKEALHHTQVARALLAAGLGDQARLEAARAVELEPASVVAHRIRGWVLMHDLIGREYKKGSDLDGAAAAYRKALEFDPKDLLARLNLAILLEHNADGVRYGAGAKLGEAIKEYGALPEKLGPSSPYFLNLPIALMWARKFDELREFIKKQNSDPKLDQLRLVTTAAKEGPDAAVKEAARTISNEQSRRDTLTNSAQLLIGLRLYPEAATLFSAAARGASNSPELLARAEIMRKTRRYEEVQEAKDDPRTVVRRFMASLFLEKDIRHILPLFTKEVQRQAGNEEGLEDAQKTQRGFRSMLSRQGVGPELIVDVGVGMMQMALDGDDAKGYRIRAQFPGAGGGSNLLVFVVLEEGELRILAGFGDFSELGAEALRREEKGDLAGARRLLDWAREEIPSSGGDDPFAGPPFPRFWTKGSNAGLEEIRHAAAALMVRDKHCEKAIAILQEGRTKAASDEVRQNFDTALAAGFASLKRHQDALEISRRFLKAKPESLSAFSLAARSLHSIQRWDELRALAEERLRRVPDDPTALRALATLEEHTGNYAATQRLLDQLIQNGKAEAVDFNNWSWEALFSGSDMGKALEAAHRACSLTGNQNDGFLHTLASLYAEAGKTTEAREIIIHAMEVGGLEEPEPHYWYVFGRIAEQFGEKDAAAVVYQKVTPPKEEHEEPTSSYRLAQKRLAALGSAPAIAASTKK